MKKTTKSNFIPFEDWNAYSEHLVDDFKEKWKENPEKVEKELRKELDTEEIDLLKVLLHPVYALQFWLKAKYKLWTGSRDSGKSTNAGALYSIIKWLRHFKRNIVVLRKYNVDHEKTTVSAILKVFGILAKAFDRPELIPIAGDEKRKGKDALFIYYKGEMRIENSITNSNIFFFSLNRYEGYKSLSLKEDDQAIDTIWYEEPVELADASKGDLTINDGNFFDWIQIEITFLRGYRDVDDITGEQILKKGFDWVQPEVIFTTNAVNPDHWIIKDFADKYTPFDTTNKLDIEHYEKYGFRVYWDTEWRNGEGLLVVRNNSVLNPGRDKNAMQDLKEKNYQLYLEVYVGATAQHGGSAFGESIRYIETTLPDTKDMWPMSCGVDYAIAQERDYFVGTFLATDTKIYNPEDPGGGPDYTKINILEHYYWKNEKGGTFKGDLELAQDLLNAFRAIIENNNWQGKVLRSGFVFTVPNDAISFLTTLKQQLTAMVVDNSNDPKMKYLSRVACILVEGKNSKVEIEIGSGIKVGALEARRHKVKQMMDYNMLRANPFGAPFTLRALRFLSLDKFGKTIEGEYIDFWDSFCYAFMYYPAMARINQMIHYSKKKFSVNMDD